MLKLCFFSIFYSLNSTNASISKLYTSKKKKKPILKMFYRSTASYELVT